MDEQLYTAHTDGTGLKVLLKKAKAALNIAGVSSSGRWLAYQQSFPGTVNEPKLYILDLKKQNIEGEPLPFDRAVGKVKFTDDENAIFFVSQRNGGAVLYADNWQSGKPRQLTPGEEGITDYDFNQKVLVFAKTSVQDPSEIYSAGLDAKNATLLTALNTGWLPERLISLPEKHVFTDSKGLQVDYWVMKPIGFDPAKKYPLLLEIHGGPASMWGPGEESMWHEYQYFCGKGIGVVYCTHGVRLVMANRF